MCSVTELEQSWRDNFKNGPFVQHGRYYQNLARHIYWNRNAVKGRFTISFRNHVKRYDYNNPTKHLDRLIDYLDFIGIVISKESIIGAVEVGASSYYEIVRTAFSIIQNLAFHHGPFSINNPYAKSTNQVALLLQIASGPFHKKTLRKLSSAVTPGGRNGKS